jgi:predicted ester cyclase
MPTPLEVYRNFQQVLLTDDFTRLPEVADVAGYIEKCEGLTDWTTGLQIALANYQRNIVAALSDLHGTEQTIVEGADTVVIRTLYEATQTGTFLGIAPTGRHIAYEAVDILRVADGRIVWRYLLMDLYGIEQQLRQAESTALA